MDDLISRQAAIDALYHVDEYNGRSVEVIRNLPSAQPEQNAYEQGRITGRVEMRTEILSALKKMVGSEVWDNV